MAITRRHLINSMAQLGGAGAVYETLAIWDFLKPVPATAASLKLPAEAGKGRTVSVLGAGISGLCAAYELDRAGFDVVILEPQRRAGGRSLTLRKGDAFQEMGDNPQQVCQYEDGLYLNAGPGRIPHTHVRVIDYCRQFGVALEPYIFASRANLIHSSKLGNGRTIQVRQAYHDLQGHVAELLDKCIAKPGLDEPISGEDLASLHEMLVTFGNLTKVEKAGKTTWSYQNQGARAGYDRMPGYGGDHGTVLTPLKLEEILRSNVWNNWIFRDAVPFWQTSLMQPVGGMDMFAKGFARQPLMRATGTIEGLIRYGAKALEIDVRSDKVAVLYDDAGTQRALETDFCICTIPMPIFKTMKTNLPPEVTRAAANIPIMDAGKVGWQAERFWEVNDQIYGGISWIDSITDQVWYPSSGFLSAKGTLTGAYMRGEAAEQFNKLSVAERLRIARAAGEKLHPGVFSKLVEHGVAIGWGNMEHARHGWANDSDPRYGAHADVLAKSQGRFKLAGDHTTFMPGWQEGAVLGAWEAVKYIDRQVNPTANRG
jgi:monoamine oxidase